MSCTLSEFISSLPFVLQMAYVCVYIYMHAYKVSCFSCIWQFSTVWIVAHLCPWGFPGENTGVGCHFLLQGIFPTQRSNPHFLCLLHCRQILYHCATWKVTNMHIFGSWMLYIISIYSYLYIYMHWQDICLLSLYPFILLNSRLWGDSWTHIYDRIPWGFLLENRSFAVMRESNFFLFPHCMPCMTFFVNFWHFLFDLLCATINEPLF